MTSDDLQALGLGSGDVRRVAEVAEGFARALSVTGVAVGSSGPLVVASLLARAGTLWSLVEVPRAGLMFERAADRYIEPGNVVGIASGRLRLAAEGAGVTETLAAAEVRYPDRVAYPDREGWRPAMPR